MKARNTLSALLLLAGLLTGAQASAEEPQGKHGWDINSRVEPRFQPGQPLLVTAFSRLAEGQLDRTFERYVHLPVLSFSIGYAF